MNRIGIIAMSDQVRQRTAKGSIITFINALVGEKYGSIRIPGEVESSEFEMILDAAVEATLDTRILEEWYCRDENAVPPAYYLKPKSEMLKTEHNAMDSTSNSQNDKTWQNISEEIKKIFKTAVSSLQKKGTMNNNQAKRFLCSALEDELDFALGKQTPAFLKKCVCYIRKIANFDRHAKLPEMGRYMDTIVESDKVVRNQEAHERLVKLRDEFIPTVVASSNLRVYTSVTHCDMKLGYSQEVENHYVEGLCKQFYEDMVDIIQATVQQNFDTETDPLYDEVLQHLSLCKTYASFYEHRCEALDMIFKYILPNKAGRMNPLIVYGGPCTGKTLLLAEVAKQAYAWLQKEMGPDTDPVVIVRFLGSTEVGAELRSLLQSICEQTAINYRCLVHSNSHKIQDLKELLVNLMNESSYHRPLIIILDAVEQLSDSDEARKLWWLPIHLPRSVRIVVSTLPNKHGILQKMRCLIHDEDNYVELTQRDRKMCSQILKHQLLKVKRSGEKLSTVTSEFSGGFVKSILILDTLQEMVMIDNEGNLSVWNTEEVTNPRIIEDFDCSGEDNEVVSIELSEDQSAILICKAKSIEVLDTGLWKMAEKFKAKRNERFVSAVLSKTAECIVASMENSSSIFVWRRDSGQCMASLEDISGYIVKLVKSNHHNLLLSLTTSGVVSIWDIDIITAMSNIDKTGKTIQSLLLPGRGELMYTLDGSEAVHKWNFSTGFIETVFKHEGIVENCVLTSSGDLMVTSDDKCSQYVWHTATGENIFRINGQKISQLLITHNDQFVVSLCEQNASRVWRLATGHKVCNILVALQNAFITTANTFLIGMTKNKLLAVSLWSGSVTKKFCCDDGTSIVNVKLIPDCPDYVVFITSTETVYIWSVAEESICRRVQLPTNFLKTLEDFQISPNGKLGIMSRGDENINVLDLHSGKLRIVHASGVIWRQRLSRDGRYLVYICFQNGDDDDDSVAASRLIVMRLADGKSIGSCSLYKTPTFLGLSQRHLNIIVGFEDGSLGTYTVVDRVDAALKINIATSNSRQIVNNASQKVRPKCGTFPFKTIADCVWRESTEVFSRDSPINVSDSGEAETTPTKKQNYCSDRVSSAIDCKSQGFLSEN
ncbi:UNVERIFIED_CONTAM: hypothetical protein FKN15_035183 [Acipenser sinensis]